LLAAKPIAYLRLPVEIAARIDWRSQLRKQFKGQRQQLMKTQIIRFAKEKDTKNTVRFNEVPASGNPPVIGTLYLQKWFCAEATECEITLEIKEGAQEKYQSENK
jgi:hypothetical protein